MVTKSKTALTGMKEICRYVGRSEETVLNWIRKKDFPAKKINEIWESDAALIDRWRRKQIRIDLGLEDSEPERAPKSPSKSRRN